LTAIRSSAAPLPLPGDRLPAGLLEHPAADRHDRAAVLGERNEGVGADPAALRMLPAQQRLDAEHAAAADVELRLVLDLELATVERVQQVLLERLALTHLAVHRILEEAVAPRRIGLGAAQRQTGVLHQLLRPDAIDRQQRHADPGADMGQPAAQLERRVHRRQQTLAQLDRAGGRGDAILQDRELVRPHARQHVALAQHREHSGAGVAQQQVARDVAQRLVDRLEVGQVNRQHRRHPIAVAGAVAGAVEHRLQAIEKSGPVGQPGQRILRRQLSELRRDGARRLIRRRLRLAAAPAALDRRAQGGHDQRGHQHQRDQHRPAATRAEPARAEHERHRAGQAVEAELDQECNAEHARHLLRVPATGRDQIAATFAARG
jgi:hypothetical protein